MINSKKVDSVSPGAVSFRLDGLSVLLVEVARIGFVSPTGVNFTVTVILKNPDAEVLPGMSAAVNIVVNRVENVYLVPNRAVHFRDSQQGNYILAVAAVPDKVEIKLGLSSELYCDAVSGLEEGNRVVLNHSADFLISRMVLSRG